MIRLKKEEVMELIKKISNLHNNYVFCAIDEYLLKYPERRNKLNCAFPFPKKIRIGLLEHCMVIEYCGPEDIDSDIVSVECKDITYENIEEFLGIDLGNESVNKIMLEQNVENMTFFCGESITHLSDYFYDLTQIPYELIVMNAMIDFNSIDKYCYISNTAFFWTNSNNDLKIKKVDFMEIIPFDEDMVYYYDENTISRLVELIIGVEVPQYSVRLHKYLNELIEIISLENTTELEITTYLAEHSEILQLAFGLRKLNEQILLKWQFQTEYKDLKPDFMPERLDGFCDIMEFKMPHLNGKYMVGTNERKHPSYQIDSAIAQVNMYDEWCSQKINTDWLEKNHNIKVFNPSKYLIIGHSDDFTAENRRKLREERNIIIYTYDEFIEMVRYQIYMCK